ncbi:hypothetical protein AWB81_00509 [Caballeronia arationis]|jgi:hypothetical protein|uniref:Uncharacterized protein n=1 Tax=Caballeronia arationis TaxID=1777142 RepID=A0A7Z7I4I5_9BURK|nr:hypothetical protein AWB81_00509 [Caballeronia arationis]SOE58797.1 hypothetical protein SAMN05446927_1648 [Caballeronia arationis]
MARFRFAVVFTAAPLMCVAFDPILHRSLAGQFGLLPSPLLPFDPFGSREDLKSDSMKRVVSHRNRSPGSST